MALATKSRSQFTLFLLANYEAGTVVEFNKKQAFSVLENIRMTFGLRKEAGPMK